MKTHELHFVNQSLKHYYWLFITVIFLTIPCSAQEQATSKNVGVFDFEKEVINYGTIEKNDNGLRTFSFTNRGTAPIVISKVKTSCGCTVPTYPKQAIMPGESANIDIKYATNRVGTFNKTITILSNADEQKKTLRIKGTVIEKSLSKS